MSKKDTKTKKSIKQNTTVTLDKKAPRQFSCGNNRSISVPLLYKLVYSSKTSFITVFILLLSFVCQGVSVTYAEEIPPSELPQAADINPVPEVEIEAEPKILVADTEVNTAEVAYNSDGLVNQEAADIQATEESSEVTNLATAEVLVEEADGPEPDTSPLLDDPPIAEEDNTVNETNQTPLPNNDDLSVISTEEPSTTTSTSSPFTEANDSDTDEREVPFDDESVTTNNGDEESANAEVATTTESDFTVSTSSVATSTDDQVEEAVTVTNSDTEFTFNRNECTTLASGSFYCLKADTELLEDALFAAPDSDGDLEIYLVRDGLQSQVTSNLVDDAAPFYDQNSDTIVWHRLIDDRYQVISYDISSGVETQLTSGEANSMEPTRQGKYTVWQNWSNNNWNIVLFDGKEQKTITESSAHDIAPYVHGSLVVWNRYSSGQDKTIEMYDMISETYVTVDDPEGLSVTNPRMVFVYDSLHPNGDVVTKGYDMISRKFIQLDTLPRQLPDEIPESESTGETRALIQSKPSVKSDESIHNTATSTGSTPPSLPPPSASSSDPMTLDLTLASSTTTDTISILDVPVMAEYELVIAPLQIPVETVQE